MSIEQPIRVLIADDHPHGREGMREILSRDPSFQIVGEALHGEQAVTLAAELGPDLVLMDINMPVMNGMEATQLIKTIDPRIKIVMVTVSDDIVDLFEAVKRGAQGYLLKNLSPSSWLEYLRGVAMDEAPMSKELAFRLLQEFNGGGRMNASNSDAAANIPSPPSRSVERTREAAGGGTAGQGTTPLTQREHDILERVALGDSNRQIAETFGISEHTVKNHLKNILQKLHLDNRVQLTRYALEKGLFGGR
ncbi:response regulator [Paenibacillus mendelii]|uniref:Response regulator n=1 Tax=Paenibacillus mendelii TaxID=206163 RepID=A0ABV6JBK2_9BACL|nr:response regulator transcription factor [Paenibacillus mendelii]MCQ6559614.1 response regulator transcription factor [Paenibacillus mendelii]